MPHQQKPQERHAWTSPTIIVLTRDPGAQPPILTECKTQKRQGFNFANMDCRTGRSKFTCANMSCANSVAL